MAEAPWKLLTGVLLVAALAVSACGGDEGGEDGAAAGGSIEMSVSAAPDFLDPALAFTLPALEGMWLVYTPLVTYEHAEGREGARLIPGLAEALPEISDDGTSYTLRLRDGLEYSDGTPVRAGDFEHAVKRALALESPGSAFLMGIAGAEEYLKAGKPNADLEGIEADDETGEIRIELLAPDGTFSNVLATTFTAPVPGDTPMEDQTADPPPGTGPFELVRGESGGEFALERNEGFSLSGLPEATLDRIAVQVVESPEAQTQDVISGELDYMQDPPAPDLLETVRSEHADRYEEFPTGSTSYLFLNTRAEPFDDPRAREAVHLAIDKPGLARLYGGLLEPSCEFLPPAVPGYRPMEPCPFREPDDPPDLDGARELIEASGADGAPVKVWGPSEDPGAKVTEAYADTLNQIGLDARPQTVPFTSYIQTIGDADTGAQTGVIDFHQDFPHPANYLGQFSGDVIADRGNINFGNVEDPEITRTIERLRQVSDVESVEEEWADVDRALIEGAYVVPIGHQKRTTFMSERMDFEDCSIVHPVYVNDYSSFCLAE